MLLQSKPHLLLAPWNQINYLRPAPLSQIFLWTSLMPACASAGVLWWACLASYLPCLQLCLIQLHFVLGHSYCAFQLEDFHMNHKNVCFCYFEDVSHWHSKFLTTDNSVWVPMSSLLLPFVHFGLLHMTISLWTSWSSLNSRHHTLSCGGLRQYHLLGEVSASARQSAWMFMLS